MKFLIPLLVLSAVSTAQAHPGGSLLTCRPSKNNLSSQKIEISLKRSNGKGWYSPIIDVNFKGNNYNLHTPLETENYGLTFHNSPLKTITVTADVPSLAGSNSGDFSIVAIPHTVKSFDYEGKPTVWTIEAEKDECYDSAGSATFQGIIRGFLDLNNGAFEIEPQILDCELTYNSGMSC